MKGMISILCLAAASFVEGQMIPPRPGLNLSPVEQSLAEARETIAANPAQYQGYNALATALVRRAQQTSDSSLYTQAEAAIMKSLQLVQTILRRRRFECRSFSVSMISQLRSMPQRD